jgi:hypothetical protein
MKKSRKDGDWPFDRQSIGIQICRISQQTPPRAGELLKLSLRGVKVVLDSAIPSREAVTLKLENRSRKSEFVTAGKVSRLEPGKDGNWIIGCLFNQQLPQSALREFFQDDIAEQRKEVRYPVVGEATIDWDSGPQNVAVILQNLSAGGFRMLSREAVAMDARLDLVLRLTDRRRFVIPAATRWQIEDPAGYTIGCQFLYDQGQHLMKAILPAIDDEDQTNGALNLSQILRKLTHLPLFGRSD